jgi:hypothetical protein
MEVTMRQYNPNPGPDINPELKKQQTSRPEPEKEEEIMISSLINSIYYFIESVFILKIKDKYRLVVLHDNRVLTDKYYQTGRGCKIAFQKLFKDKAWSKEIKAHWSHFYDPDKDWLGKKCQSLEW